MNEIFGIVKKYAGEIIAKNADIPQEKKEIAVETTTESINEGLKKYLNPSNIAGLAGMLSGKGDTGSSGIMDTLQKSLIGSLTNKAGLSSQASSGIASALLPMIIKSISGKMNDPANKTFDVESLINAFSGKGQGEGHGILESISHLFK